MKKLVLAFSILFSTGLFAQWDVLNTNVTFDFKGIAFTSQDSGIVVGMDSATVTAAIIRTTDGGTNWSMPTFPSGLEPLNGISFYGSLNGCIVGDDGRVLLTTNGGANWDTTIHFTNENLYCVSFPTQTTIFAGGESGALFRSYDAGLTWDTLDGGTSLAIREMYFIHAAAGWIVADGGYLAATGDGGDTFYNFTQPYYGFFQPLGYAYAGTTDLAFCVGADGLAITSIDAGLNWDTFPVPGTQNLNQVGFMNDFAGIICGDDGFIYRTQDGGISWMIETNSSVTDDLYDIAFGGDTIAYICGDHGRVLKTHTDISAVQTYSALSLNASVYPNPFESELNLVLDLQNNSEVLITITDLTGRIISQENKGELSAGKNSIRINGMESLAPGMYFVTVNAAGSMLSLPVIRK